MPSPRRSSKPKAEFDSGWASAGEIATAVALGLPALVREGVTWSDMRLRALSTAPVRLSGSEREMAGAKTT